MLNNQLQHPLPPRFLLIQTAFIGDVILCTPLIEKLKAAYPDAAIDLFLRKGNEGLFEHHPHIRTLYIWDKKGAAKYVRLWSMVLKIRRQRYDFCINLQRHGTTGLITLSSGARETIGFTMNPLSRFFTRRHVHKINPAAGLTHEVDLYLQLVTGIVPDIKRIPPRLYPRDDDFKRVAIEGPYVTIAPTSVWFTKQYPPEMWVRVIDLIDPGITVCLIGGKPDVASCAWIKERTAHPKVENYAGALTFLQSAALIKNARMNYVNDSAPLHIASAVGAPVTAVFCSTIPAFGYGPLGAAARVVEAGTALPCRPCGPHGHKRCPQGHFRCADIAPEVVAGKP
jgi:ADP-heptose:LPS heptosyltransferase